MRWFLVIVIVVAACTGSEDRVDLPNSSGKEDSAAIRVKLTESNKVVSFTVQCDHTQGCDGHIAIELKSPEPCVLFPDDARCGVARTQPLAREVLTTEIVSSTEGRRSLPLRIESGDGQAWTNQMAAGFTAFGQEQVEITLTKAADAPELTIHLRAEWKPKAQPTAEIDDLRAFLGTVPGLTYTEIATAAPGYRAFLLQYDQPLDHNNPSAGTFKQQIVLHHKAKAAPMVLYTSGYALFAQDNLSELGEGLQSNQLNTEQRWFGSSKPANVTPESWQLVTIEQAAKDHHRIVQVFESFYRGKWLNTGHSKGGMTSIFHRRFFPADVDATVAYVAPISFAYPDPRYLPHLDQIGESTCRDAIRSVQKKALEPAIFDQLLAFAQSTHGSWASFERSGGLASSLEKDITGLEWAFWQYSKAANCGPFLNAPTDARGLFNLLAQWSGVGAPDSAYESEQFLAYQWQAATQLGMQAYATAHLAGLLRYDTIKVNMAPEGTAPVHTRAAMDDVQNWVKTQGTQILFVYGGSDPWTGGAFETGTQPENVKLVIPDSPHASYLKDLPVADREIALGKIEQWIGARPAVVATPHVMMPWMP